MGNSIPDHHEDHIARKGEISLQHYNLVHKFIPMPQAMKIAAAKAAVDKEWEKLEKISAWNLTKVRSKKKVIDEARTAGATVHFASLSSFAIIGDFLSSCRNVELTSSRFFRFFQFMSCGPTCWHDSFGCSGINDQRSWHQLPLFSFFCIPKHFSSLKRAQTVFFPVSHVC